MRWRTGAVASVFVLLATACPGPSASREEHPVPGGTLTVAVRDLGTLDPARATGRGALSVLAQVFDPLTAIDAATGKAVPAAAAEWAVSPDGLTWTFRIRKATWHDGRRVRARDFAFALDRVARKDTDAPAAFLLDAVRGFPAAHDTGRARRLAGVEAERDDLLVIRLARPFADLPYVLAHPSFAPLPVHRYGRSTKGLATAPVGNGPFRIARVERSALAEVERNEGYTGTSALVERIRFRVVGSVDEGWRDLLAGRVDVADAPPSVVASARGRYGEGGFSPAWATLSFGANLRHRTFRDPEVRRAISMAIDRAAIAATIFGETKEPATGLLPRGMRGYAEDACASCVLDRPRATAIVRRVFGEQPKPITIDHLNDGSSTRVARAVANDLERVGFRPTLRGHDERAYRRLLASGEAGLAQLGWLADVPTPDGFLGRQLGSGSVDNVTGFSDGEFDRLIARARRTIDEGVRIHTYRRAEARALDQMPLIPLVFFRNRTAAAEHVRGFTLDGAGIFDGTSVWLARR